MKNSDMPAMPFVKTTLKGVYNGNETSEVVDGYEGLTKREMFAMHAMSSMQVKNYQCAKDMAQDAVSMADALLEELSK